MPDVSALFSEFALGCGLRPPSSLLEKLLVLVPPVEELDLHGYHLGTNCAAVLLSFISTHMPDLRVLNLGENNLNSNIAVPLVNAMEKHPRIVSIDISDNDLRLAGPDLVRLLKSNHHITDLKVEDSKLRDLFIKLIAIQLRQNNEIAGKKKKTQAPTKPSGRNGHEVKFGEHAGDAAQEMSHASANAQPSQEGACMEKSSSSKGENDEVTGSEREIVFAAEDNWAEFNFNKNTEDYSPFTTFDQIVSETAVSSQPHEEGFPCTHEVPLRRGRRCTVAAEVFSDDEIDSAKIPEFEKPEKEFSWLMRTLEKHDLFSHIEDHELGIAIRALEKTVRSAGDILYEAGEDDNDTFYVVRSGEIELMQGKRTTKMSEGSTLNDLALLYPSQSDETAKVTKDAVLYIISRQLYKIIIARISKKKRKMYEGFLQTVGFLKAANVSKAELLQLADSLKSVTFNPGDYLIHYGERGEAFFIIVEGQVEVVGRNANGEPIQVCVFTTGDCVGELEFIMQHKCVADVRAVTDVRAAKMNRLHFELVMGNIKEVLKRTADESETYTYYREQLQRIEEGSNEHLKYDLPKQD